MADQEIRKPRLAYSIRNYLIPFFTLFGLIAVIGGAYQIIDTSQYRRSAEEVNCFVTDITSYAGKKGNTAYHISIDYMLEGDVYSTVIDRSYRNVNIGDVFTAYTDPENPDDVRTDISIGRPVLSVIVGVFFAIPILGAMLRVELRNRRLLKEGKRVECKIAEVRYSNYNDDSRKNWIIVCQGQNPYTGEPGTYKSPEFRSNPGRYLEHHRIETMPVCFDSKGKKYYMDVSGITK